MGVQGANAVLHQVEDLTLDHLEAASRARAELWGKDMLITSVIDASWNGMRSGRRDAVEYLVDTLRALEASVAELQGLYEEAIENQAFHVPHETRCPLLQSRSITDGTLEHITTFNFEDGGRTVHDPQLKADELVELTTFLSKRVTFSDYFFQSNHKRGGI